MPAWLFGSSARAIASELIAAYGRRENAKTDQARIEAEAEISQIQARQAVLIAEQGSWLTAWIRPAIAAPFVAYLWKVIVWDMLLGFGSTPPLGEQMFWVMTVVVGGYFLTRPFEKVFRR